MKESGWGHLRTFLVILVGAIAVSACGGGGGGGGDGEPTYTGNREPALIDGFNAEELALGSLEAGEMQAGMGADPTGGSMNSLALAQTLSTTLPSEDLMQPTSLSEPMESQTMYGNCGGWLSQSITVSQNGSFNGSMQYASYCMDGVTIDGSVTFSGSYNELNDTIKFTMRFKSLTSSSTEVSFTSSGSLSIDMSLDPYSQLPMTLSMTMNLENTVTEEVCRLEGYTVTMTPGDTYDVVTVAGRYYHGEIGYVDVSTDPEIQYSAEVPESGKMLFQGANGTWATLEFTGSGGYRIEASDGTIVTGTLVEGTL